MGKIPADVRGQVAAEVIKRAIELVWEDLSMSERSRTYEMWVDDPLIGGKLRNYIPATAIRVWIKDGPMKEYARARRGIGSYARFVGHIERLEDEIVRRVLGSEWEIVDEKLGVKPANFRARRSSEIIRIYWGNVDAAKHLLWAALSADIREKNIVVILGTRITPVSDSDRRLLQSIAERTSTEIKFVNL